jgi:2'-5' RNA ligase
MPLEKRMAGLGIFLSGDVARRVNRWRKLYDPSYPELAPHVTLAYPPFVHPDEWQQVRGAVAECLAAYPPFSIRLDGVGVFCDQPIVLWLNPNDGGVLGRIRKNLEKCFPQYVPTLPFDYQPHVSIGFFEDEAKLEAARQRVEKAWKPLEFTAQEFVYAIQAGEDKWEMVDRIPLKV